MTKSRKQPPVGGASLQALFAYDDLLYTDVAAILRSLLDAETLSCDIAQTNARKSDFDFVEPQLKDSPIEFLSCCFSGDFEEVFFCFHWSSDQYEVPINLTFDLCNLVVSLSSEEDCLWANSEPPDHLDYAMLNSFYSICERVCATRSPHKAAIGSEPCHAEDIRVGNASDDFDFVHSTFFSEAEKKKLLDWYRNVYFRRWEQSRRLE